MENKLLLLESGLTIEYDVVHDWLYVDWIGAQSLTSVQEGCEKILGFLQTEHCHKILNDNARVTSIWSDATDWLAFNWFPRATAAGLQYLAWIYSPDVYSRLSTDETLRKITDPMAIAFNDMETAKAWLQRM